MYGIAITVVSYNTCTFDSREASWLQEVLAAAQSMMRLGFGQSRAPSWFWVPGDVSGDWKPELLAMG